MDLVVFSQEDYYKENAPPPSNSVLWDHSTRAIGIGQVQWKKKSEKISNYSNRIFLELFDIF